MNRLILAAAVGLLTVTTPALAQAPAGGAELYQSKCGGCHSIAANRVGPAHKGVFGRKAGMAPNYSYSAALKASGIVWDEATLDRWLQGPQKVVKGTKMFFTVPDAAQRKAIIAYLKSPAAR
jgi:cytochrome c